MKKKKKEREHVLTRAAFQITAPDLLPRCLLPPSHSSTGATASKTNSRLDLIKQISLFCCCFFYYGKIEDFYLSKSMFSSSDSGWRLLHSSVFGLMRNRQWNVLDNFPWKIVLEMWPNNKIQQVLRCRKYVDLNWVWTPTFCSFMQDICKDLWKRSQ